MRNFSNHILHSIVRGNESHGSFPLSVLSKSVNNKSQNRLKWLRYFQPNLIAIQIMPVFAVFCKTLTINGL